MAGHLILQLVLGAVAALATAVQAFDLQGHRGARGLAPENTLAGFRKALEIGVTTLETDLALTLDGVLVIAHDPELNPALVRGPNGLWLRERGPPIITLTLAQLRTYDIGRVNPTSGYGRQWPLQWAVDGERFPTLAELMDLVRTSGKQVRLSLETKLTPTSGATTPDPDTFARPIVDALRAAGLAERATVQSFDWRTLVAVRALAPEVATVCLTSESSNFDTTRADASGGSPWHAGLKLADHGGSVPRLVKAAGCGTWSANFQHLSRDRIAEAHALGLKVLPWTVNDPADIDRMIDMGTDGVITDYPDRARKAMAERGMALP